MLASCFAARVCYAQAGMRAHRTGQDVTGLDGEKGRSLMCVVTGTLGARVDVKGSWWRPNRSKK